MSSSSKVVSSKVMDMELPGLTFHEMCWSRVKSHGERTALVSPQSVCQSVTVPAG